MRINHLLLPAFVALASACNDYDISGYASAYYYGKVSDGCPGAQCYYGTDCRSGECKNPPDSFDVASWAAKAVFGNFGDITLGTCTGLTTIEIVGIAGGSLLGLLLVVCIIQRMRKRKLQTQLIVMQQPMYQQPMY